MTDQRIGAFLLRPRKVRAIKSGCNLTYGKMPNTVMTVATDSHRIPNYLLEKNLLNRSLYKY
jgi:hypothetical protein